MQGNVYAEYLECPTTKGRLYIGMPGPRQTMTLTWPEGEVLRFTNRRKCLEWLLQVCPEWCIYAFNEGATVCGGTVRNLCKRAGIKERDPVLFT